MIVIDWNQLRLVFGDFLDKNQIDGFNAIIDAFNTLRISDKRIIAYILATCVFETSKKMLPKEEVGTDDYFRSMYDILGERSAVAIRMGNTEEGDGKKYKKRGVISLLGKSAYATFGELIGEDLVNNPELVLDLKISTKLLVEGMLKGWYTGVSLYNYITPSKTDYINARRTVNGVDNSKRISLMAEQLEKTIKEST